VSAVQLRDIRDQFPVGLVRRQFLVRALLDDTVSAEATRAVSTTSSEAGRAHHDWSGAAALQLRSLDVRRPACSWRQRTTRSRLPGASGHTRDFMVALSSSINNERPLHFTHVFHLFSKVLAPTLSNYTLENFPHDVTLSPMETYS